MKSMHLCYRGAVGRQLYRDHAIADAAYETIKKAMADFKEYGNDRDKTVSYSTEFGEGTIRLADLISIDLNDHDASEEFEIDLAVRNRRLEAKIAARLTPAAHGD